MTDQRNSWPSEAAATLEHCQHLHNLTHHLDAFFGDQGFLPFYSPILQPSPGFDPTNTVYTLSNPDNLRRFLRTSPERSMKLHLALHQASIFEIGKVFRGGRDNLTGPHHHHEFWMCEWYHLDADMQQSLSFLSHLLEKIWHAFHPKQAFAFKTLPFDELFYQATSKSLSTWLKNEDPSTCLEQLDYIYADGFHPLLAKQDGFVVITQFPAPLAALANSSSTTQHLEIHEQRFDRWELSYKGIELLNGYTEITDVNELKKQLALQKRFQSHEQRHDAPLMDAQFSQILENFDFPACSGAALGMDRLLMVLLSQETLQTHSCYDS